MASETTGTESLEPDMPGSSEPAVDIRRMLLQTLESWQAAGISHLNQVSVPAATVASSPAPTIQKQTTQKLPGSPTVVSETDSSATSAPSDKPVRPLPTPQFKPSEFLPESNTEMPKKPVAAKSLLASVESVEVAAPAVKNLTRGERIIELKVLCDQVARCTRCEELATTRTQTVFGVGNPEARLLFIGEAPGADEDAQGEPFVGKAGQLLNKIIEAMQLKREDIYICNVLRCRPPGNRLPEPTEAANCREYLDGQLRIVNPEYIVCWGSCAAQNLLNSTETIGKLRKRWFTYNRAKVLCTYHPSYLLRNPAAKKDVWEDMQLVMKELGIPVP